MALPSFLCHPQCGIELCSASKSEAESGSNPSRAVSRRNIKGVADSCCGCRNRIVYPCGRLFYYTSSRRTCSASEVKQNQVRNIAPPFSLRLGHRTALVLLTPFTTVLPLRYPWEACQAGQILAGSAKKAEPWLCLFLFAIVGYGYSMHPADYFLKILTRSANFFFLMTNHTTESPPLPTPSNARHCSFI